MYARTLPIFFFVVFSMGCDLAPKKFEANIPKETVETEPLRAEVFEPPISIEIHSDGSITFDGTKYPYADSGLDSLLASVSQKVLNGPVSQGKEFLIFIRSKKDVQYRYVARVTDRLKKFEHVKIGLQVEGLNKEK
ncbi:MAG TPA: biopolymer transporter ExbD [Pyrinomonadaceae bacterium]|jgi:biopolymer transport protein ExbD|nr:biopolymer transporter ExbD [Pyrinomonadaceae bacterium]